MNIPFPHYENIDLKNVSTSVAPHKFFVLYNNLYFV